MTMPGGGPFRLSAGQITDDSELAMCIMQGLINSNKKHNKPVFDVDKVAEKYALWVMSHPFDIGIATR